MSDNTRMLLYVLVAFGGITLAIWLGQTFLPDDVLHSCPSGQEWIDVETFASGGKCVWSTP